MQRRVESFLGLPHLRSHIVNVILQTSEGIVSCLSVHAVHPGLEAGPSPVLKHPEHQYCCGG